MISSKYTTDSNINIYFNFKTNWTRDDMKMAMAMEMGMKMGMGIRMILVSREIERECVCVPLGGGPPAEIALRRDKKFSKAYI